MADTKAQTETEKWIKEVFLPKKYGQPFRQKSLTVQSRGQIKFDAVSDDKEIEYEKPGAIMQKVLRLEKEIEDDIESIKKMIR